MINIIYYYDCTEVSVLCKTYCFSSQDVNEKQLDTDSAYILFYERQSIDVARFMPDISGREPDTADIDDEFESDFKKMCVLQ